MNAAAHSHSELLELLQSALVSYEAGDNDGYRNSVDALVEWRSRPLQAVLARLAHSLSDSLTALPVNGSAANELPDARARLDHVLTMTEQAAHKTLDCVEDSRRTLETLAAHDLPPGCEPLVAALRRNLSDMALAQEYQDLGGQIIRRVLAIVQRVESALLELAVATPAHVEAGTSGIGPAVPGVDTHAVSQNDADALLAGLGL